MRRIDSTYSDVTESRIPPVGDILESSDMVIVLDCTLSNSTVAALVGSDEHDPEDDDDHDLK